MERAEPFGVWLRRRRKTVLGLTQAQLAFQASCSETMVRKIEQGIRRPARDLAERLLIVLGTPTGDLAAEVAWARGLTAGSIFAVNRGVELNSTVDGSLLVLAPLDAIASFGTEQPTVIQLREPFMGRLHWTPVPLAAVAHFGMTPPCRGSECNGLDPEISGCARASVTVDGRDIVDTGDESVVGALELRYSQACQTNWVRITRLCREARQMYAYLRNEAGDIIPGTAVKVYAPSVYGYGSMLYAPTGEIRVQACGLVDDCDEVCTSLH